MAEFNEHVLKVRAALDKASQKEMRDAMRSIFVDESHIDFNNPDNLKGLRALADTMKKIFLQAGNIKFDFSKMIQMPGPEMFKALKEAALEFDAVWNSIIANMGNIGDGISRGISGGIVDGVSDGLDVAIKDAEVKLEALLKKQSEKAKRIEELTDQQRRKEDMAKRLDFDYAFEVDAKIKYSDDKDLKQKVREIEGVYEDALVDLMDAADTGKVTEPILEKFRDAAKEMLKVKNTVADLVNKQVLQRVDGQLKPVSKAESLFGSSLVDRLLGDDEESLEHEIGQAMDIFTKAFDLYDIREEISVVKKELVGIGDEINQITAQHPELVSRQSAAEAEERLNKIHEAYERLFVSRGDKKGTLNESKIKHIENTLNYKGHETDLSALRTLSKDATGEQLASQVKKSEKVRQNLEKAFQLYDNSTGEDWEKRAQYLIKAVAEYESILNNPNASPELLDGYEEIYEKLRVQAAAEREKLEAVVAMARGSVTGNQSDDDEATAKARKKEPSKSGGILDNPAFAHMFKKSGEQVEASGVEDVNNSLTKQSGLLENIQKLTTYIDDEYLSAGKHLADFLNDIQAESAELDEELKEILTTLNLIDANGKPTFTVRHNGEEGGGTTHNGALISDDFVLVEREDYEKVKNSRLPDATHRAAKDGVNVAEVLGYLPSKYNGGFFDVQATAKGHNLFENGIISQDVVNAAEEHIIKLVDDIFAAREHGFDIEQGGSNFSYDKERGFSFFDLEEWSPEEQKRYKENNPEETQRRLAALEAALTIFDGYNVDNTDDENDPNKRDFIDKFKRAIASDSRFGGLDYQELFDEMFPDNARGLDGGQEVQGAALIEKYNISSDEVKKKYQEIVTLQDQIDEFESKAQKTPIDMDPWNATKEQKEQIVAAWREYQKVIQEIAAMPIVETEDDEKRLLELKAKAVSLYETMYQGHLNDVTGDGYAKEYGLSAEEGRQIHVDMQDDPRKDFEKSLEGIRAKLYSVYAEAQHLDSEMFKMMSSAGGDELNGVFEKIRQDALAAKPAVDSLNDSIEETKNITQGSGRGIGTGNASSAELEAAVTKTETLQDEVEQKNKELADKDAEIARVRAENEAKLKTEADEKDRLQADLNATNQQLADVKHENELYDTALAKANEESNIKDGIIRELREQLANVKTGVSEEQASVSSEELKNVLSSIVYNVKIAHDDNDKTANKIALDEGALESTLKRVFTNVLNPHTEQNDSEPKNEPWALEKTLQTVKGVLDNIQTNTAKSESVEVAPAKTDVGNVLATENTLAAIKTAVEGINSKVVEGTKATTSSGKQEPKQETSELTPYVVDNDSDSTSDKSNDKSMKLLADISLQRKNLEKFVVQLRTAGKLTDEYQVWINNLTTFLDGITSTDDMTIWKKAFARTKTSVGIDDVVGKAEDKETAASYEKIIELQRKRNELELKYAKAKDGTPLKRFYAEQLSQMDQAIAKQQIILDNEEYELKLAKMQEEQVRNLGEAEAQAATKDEKKRLADEKKYYQKQAMVGKAGNAVGRAENTLISAFGLSSEGKDAIPVEFKQQVDEYHIALEQLRQTQAKLQKMDGPIPDEDQQDLIKQINDVNRLTDEIGGLVAEYQKLSGANVDKTKAQATTLGAQSPLSDYEAQLKQYVASITHGKGQIKSFNAETKALTYTVKTGKNEFTEYTAAVRHLDHQMVAVQGTTKRTETFFEATARKMKELTSYFSGMAIFSRITQELRRGIQYVREIDLALTELKKVTDETEESYDRFLDTAAKTGARLGTTISAVTEATATFAKLGYSMKQATEMAEAAIVYKNVGDNIESTGDAADSIISTMKGFKLEATEAMRIVDRFNEVGNRFAITSQGIGEALRLSASALSEGGNSLDESIGLITAANEVVNDPSSVGKNKLADNKVAQNEETPEKENLVGKNM